MNAKATTEYALVNPLSLLLDKDPREFTRDDLISVIERNRIERITFRYTALDGKLKEMKIPVTGRKQAERILVDGERVDGSSLFKGMMDAALSDLYVVPVYRTAFINPFDERSLDLLCRYVTNEGTLAPFAPDTILLNAAASFKQNTTMELHALGELEFFLVREAHTNLYLASKQRGYHASGPFVKSGAMLDEMVRYLSQCTGSVKYAHSEVGYVERVRSDVEELAGKQAEQMEIEFLPRPIEEAGDSLVLARWLIRNVAFKHGCVATFTPKLEEGVAGNGLHVHMALMQDGKNMMKDESGNISLPAKRVIGGLCTYADSLTAFGNTVSAAYLRLVPNQEAPTRICWSDMNRSAMIRVPLGWSRLNNLSRILNPNEQELVLHGEGRQTVELRSPDGSAIVHLLLAGITMAAEWGLTNDPARSVAEQLYVAGNVFKDQQLLATLPALPKSCVESSRILHEKRCLYERGNIFPASIINYVAQMLQAEDDEEMNQRLVDLPADDRLHETRRIMHQDIHRH
jgi:glutamine synthetase